MPIETRVSMANKNGENLSASDAIELEEAYLGLAKRALRAGEIASHLTWHGAADMLREKAGNYNPTPCFCNAL